ncbi:macrophage receptor MARCO, partial [Paramuricea clavata]
NVINSTGPKGEKGERGFPGTNESLGIKGQIGDKGEPGPKGNKGDQGPPGTNGTIATFGVKGDRGPVGPAGQNGSDGAPGQKGDQGDPGRAGQAGKTGSPGPVGLPGVNGTVGEKGANGTQGIPGGKGEKGDMEYTSYFRGSESIQCNGSNFGILRYYSTKLQLCTPHGWQYLLFEPPAGCSSYPDVVNIPEANYQAFRNADLGIIFEFNRKFVPSVISRANLNITADISPVNSTLPYEDAVMRQAVLFSNNKHLKISGISDNFWRHSNWSVMALLKFRNIGQKNVRVLGHGSTSVNNGLHLGIFGSSKKVIHGYYGNDLLFGKVKEDTWYHITWTSEKDLNGVETRCIIINGQHDCKENKGGAYQGSGATTLGAWGHEKFDDNFLLDNLIITSGIVQYSTETMGEKQLCFARTLDESLP